MVVVIVKHLVAEQWPQLAADSVTAAKLCDHIEQCKCSSEPNARDVGWAWLAASGDGYAHQFVEKHAFIPALGALQKSGYSSAAAADAVQNTRIELIVDRGLLSFRGRSSLAVFVAACAMRRAIDAQRKERALANTGLHSGVVAVLLGAAATDPLTAQLRAVCGVQFEQALVDAWLALPTHHRFVLSLLLHHRLGIADVAKIYRIHTSSAARRCASARSEFVALTREKLRAQLQLDETAMDSVMRLVSTTIRLRAMEKLPVAANASNDAHLSHDDAGSMSLTADAQ